MEAVVVDFTVVDFTVRAAGPADAGILTQMLAHLLVTERVPYSVIEERLRAALGPHCELKCTTLFGAIAQGPIEGILGYALFQLCFSVPYTSHYIKIDVFSVGAESRRDKVVARLLQYICRAAAELGARWVEVTYNDAGLDLRRAAMESLGEVVESVGELCFVLSCSPPSIRLDLRAMEEARR